MIRKKIQKQFWNDIVAGKKLYEIRDEMIDDHEWEMTDTKGKKVYGKIDVLYLKPLNAFTISMIDEYDINTRAFIMKNYDDRQVLFVYKIKGVEVYGND